MKNWVLLLDCGILAVILMISCGTTQAIMIRNSYGYDYKSQREDIRRLGDKKPDWIISDQSRKDWEERNNKKGTIQFFYGTNNLSNVEVERMGKLTWTYDDAQSSAYVEVLRQVADYINTRVTSVLSDAVTGDMVIEENTSMKNNVKTKEQNIRGKATTNFSSSLEAKSGASYNGLYPELIYTETYEQVIKKKIITVTRVWAVYGITNENINDAIKKINQQLSLEEQEEEYLKVLIDKYKITVEELDRMDLSSNKSEEQYIKSYHNLLFINASLQTLSTLQKRDDSIGLQYRNLLDKCKEKIIEYNPNDRLHNIIVGLEKQLTELRIENARKEGMLQESARLVTQQFIIPFPQRPAETIILTANIFSATNLISNREYIAFESSDGINNRQRKENGLDFTTVSVSWNDAARYCNFLSNFYGLTPCYTESNRQITGYREKSNGYRLPTKNEIAAMLEAQPQFVNEKEFKEIGIWSSDGDITAHVVYKLSGNSGSASERLLYQTVRNTISDPSIGFRIVRNAE